MEEEVSKKDITYKGKEIYKALIEGKKLINTTRPHQWDDDQFMFLNEDNILIDESGIEINLNNFIDDSFKEYKEPKKKKKFWLWASKSNGNLSVYLRDENGLAPKDTQKYPDFCDNHIKIPGTEVDLDV